MAGGIGRGACSVDCKRWEGNCNGMSRLEACSRVRKVFELSMLEEVIPWRLHNVVRHNATGLIALDIMIFS